MESYDLKEIAAGDDKNSIWVSLGFSSELEELDVLHIVCGKSIDEQDRKTGMDGIYLERFDQAYSGYKGADAIQISDSEIRVGLNKEGQESLDFGGEVVFHVPKKLKGLAKARKIFAEMPKHECGKVIEILKE